METFHYGTDRLTSSMALHLARKEIKGVLTEETMAKVNASAEAVRQIAKGDKTVYGINTGFGPLCTSKISEADTRTLQENLLKSHAVGLGDPVPDEISNLMLVL